jgi:2-keto-4-pentenoate hydratase
MTRDRIAAASECLLRHRQLNTRLENLAPHLLPQNKPEAYQIQALIEQQSTQPLAAWKLAATSIAGQKHIGVSGPLIGRYIAERVVPSGGVVPFGNNGMKVAEIEFAFRFGGDLPPRAKPYSAEEIFEAVASMHPAIEIPDSRFEHFECVGELSLIADNACAHWLCIGEAAPEHWRKLDLAAFAPTGQIRGKEPVTGRGANVLGSPYAAMTWFVNEMSSLGITARAGQVVSTGTCLVPMPISPGEHVTGDFGSLGKVEVTLGS